jgi:hypothetical protein
VSYFQGFKIYFLCCVAVLIALAKISGIRATLFWALLASGQITMRKVLGRRPLADRPSDQPIDLAA